MSLLSKLLGGDKQAEKAAKTILNGIFAEQNAQSNKPAQAARPEAPANTYHEPAAEDGPHGFSWGDNMPAEENQFNFNGSYDRYFEMIFREDFPEYPFRREDISYGRRTVYKFMRGGSVVLAVELMSDSCSAYKFRNDCRRNGIPYLRFYIDHDGWWNTRAYVRAKLSQHLV